MRWLALAAGLMIAGPVWAQDFAYRGQWEIRLPEPGYIGVVLIDAEGRVTQDSPMDNGRPAQYRGYAQRKGGSEIVMHLTNGRTVSHFYCAASSSELMHCYAARPDNTRSREFLLVKVGPGPHRLTRAP
jgi:hypothetical protein